jgi:hypothetical protein
MVAPRLGGRGGKRFVTIGTGDFGVPAGERKPCLSMALGRESRGLESGGRVALAASIRRGRRRELATMLVGMAIVTSELAGLIDGVFARRFVAFGTGERRVFALERESGALVRIAIETAGLESGFGVAGGTIGTGGSGRELAAVRIFVAIAAALVRDRLVEVSGLMA